MQGYQLTFLTQQDRKHGHQALAEWLVEEARRMGIRGATLIAGSEGFGRHRRIHSVHFIEQGDQPLEIIMVVTPDEATRMLARLDDEGISLFYVKAAVEFGMTAATGPT